MDGLEQFGIQIIQGLQLLSPALDGLMGFFTFLGTIQFYLILIPFLYWNVDTRLGLRVLFLLVGSGVGTDYLKQLMHLPRPYWVGGVRRLSTELSYGIPSGHASGSLAIGALLAARFRQRWLWGGLAALIFFIGLSRMYLGVHFPHDVVAGWALGLASAYLFVKAEMWVAPWLRARSEWAQLALAFGASVVIILGALLVQALISGSPDPAGWAAFSRQARSISPYFTGAGTLLGGSAGYVHMRRRAPFRTDGAWARRLARFALGAVGTFLVLEALDGLFALLAEDETLLGYLLRYVRYAATAYYATFGAPALFLRLKLAQPEIANGHTA
ncbi:MAG: phosphatase PAP2 family protein [Anaerolineales bacterium]